MFLLYFRNRKITKYHSRVVNFYRFKLVEKKSKLTLLKSTVQLITFKRREKSPNTIKLKFCYSLDFKIKKLVKNY